MNEQNLRKRVKTAKNCKKKNQIRKLGFLLDIAKEENKEEDEDIIIFLGLLKK